MTRPRRHTLNLVAGLALVGLAIGGCGDSEAPNDAKDGAKTPGESSAPAPKELHPAMLDPALANEKAPARFRAKFETTAGDFVIETTRSWSPLGADRFYNLVKIGYYDDVVFFRVVDGFMVQWGIHGDPRVNAVWREYSIDDDVRAVKSNRRGYVSFAKSGPNTRTTQVFINFVSANGPKLDPQGFTPFGRVVEGMDSVDAIYKGYGETADQGKFQQLGNAYVDDSFPQMDRIKRAYLVD